jgi:DNA repair exonuclease SbcCD ATPase subunit
MRNSLLTLAALACMSGTLLTSCNTPSQKVEKAQENVDEANKKLDQANEEYLAEVEFYRKEAAAKIEANEKSIAEFKARKESLKQDARADYESKLFQLEEKNTDMKKKMEDYKLEGRDKWDTFKSDFGRGMDEIGKAFSELAGTSSN